MSGRVYAVASGKGGVGKTTTVANLGVMIRSAGHTVAVVDGDLGMPNLATLLGIEPDTTLHDVLAGEATVEEAIVTAGDGFSVLAGSKDLREFAAADPSNLGDVIATLAATHDYVLVDTSAGLSYEGLLPLGLVDGIVLVTTPEEVAIGDAAKTAAFAGTIDGTIEGVVVTRADGDADAEAIAAELGAELLAVIPDDDAVAGSTEAGEPLLTHAPDSDATEAYRRLAAAVTGEDVPVPDPDDDVMAESDTENRDEGEATTDGSGGFLSWLSGLFR